MSALHGSRNCCVCGARQEHLRPDLVEGDARRNSAANLCSDCKSSLRKNRIQACTNCWMHPGLRLSIMAVARALERLDYRFKKSPYGQRNKNAPDVKVRREEVARRSAHSASPAQTRLIFIDESGAKTNMTPALRKGARRPSAWSMPRRTGDMEHNDDDLGATSGWQHGGYGD